MTLPASLAVAWLALVCAACVLIWLPPLRRRLCAARFTLLLAALLAVLARLIPALLPLPPDAIIRYDIDSYRAVADAVRHGQDVYDLTGRYPYLPMHLYVVTAAWWLAVKTGLPFVFLVKLPSIIADVMLTLLVAKAATALGRRDGGGLALTYALNPISVLVSGYHGQFDAIPTLLVFAAWHLLLAHHTWRGAAVSGLLLGLAIADKTWPLLLAPVLLWPVPRSGRDVDSAIAAHLTYLAIAALPVIACLFLYERLVPGSAVHALQVVSGYQGVVGAWGYSSLLVHTATPDMRAQIIQDAGLTGPWVLALALLVAYLTGARLRREPDRPAIVLSMTYAAAAGWGVHWLAWLVPFAVVAARRWAAVFLILASSYMAATYLGYGGIFYGVAWLAGSLDALNWFPWINLACWGALVSAAVSVCTWTLLVRPLGQRLRRRGDARRRLRPAAMPVPTPTLPRPPTAPAVSRSSGWNLLMRAAIAVTLWGLTGRMPRRRAAHTPVSLSITAPSADAPAADSVVSVPGPVPVRR